MLKWIFRGLVIGFLTLACVGLMTLLGNRQWWLALAIAIALYVLGGLAIKTLARRAILVPFKLKGQVLQGAKLQIHAVTVASPPAEVPEDETHDEAPEDEDNTWNDEEVLPKAYYQLDITMTPLPPTGKMRLWEPAELLVVPYESADDLDVMTASDSTGYVEDVHLFTGSEWTEDEAGKYEGEHRVRLLVAVPEGMRTAKLRYYFESFGHIHLPKS